jgi:hypothetical protein
MINRNLESLDFSATNLSGNLMIDLLTVIAENSHSLKSLDLSENHMALS